ncbi:MAG: HIT family protein [Anaerolineae bacterium]
MPIDSDLDVTTNCPFCHIVQDETAGCRVLEDDQCLAFLDHRPVFNGHVLLIPKVHYTTLTDLPAILFTPLLANVQLLARAIELGLQADGAFVALNYRVSQSVWHVHWHIIPRNRGDGLRGFLWPRLRYRDETHMQQIAIKLRDAVVQLQSGIAR